MILSDAHQAEHFQAQGLWGTDSLDQLFRHHVATRPDAPCLRDGRTSQANGSDGAAAGRALTFAEANIRVEGLATFFSSLGLSKDGVLAIQAPNSVDTALTMLAAWRAGLTVTTLPLIWRMHEMRKAMPHIAPKAVVTVGQYGDDPLAERMMYLAAETFTIRFLFGLGDNLPDGVMPLSDVFREASNIQCSEPLERTGNPADHLALISWQNSSSFQSAVPVARSHNQLIAAGRDVVATAELDDTSRILAPLSLMSSKGLALTLVPWLLSGCCLTLHDFTDLTMLAEDADAHSFCPVPAALAPALVSHMAGKSAPDICLVHDAEHITQASALPDTAGRVLNCVCFDELGLAIQPRHDALPQPLCLGAQGTSGHIASLALHMTPDQEPGSMRLSLSGAQVPEASYPSQSEGEDGPRLEQDNEGYLLTDYLGKVQNTEKGELRIHALVNDLVRLGGLTFSAHDIDALVRHCDQVNDAAVFNIPDETMGARLIVAIVPRNGLPVALDDIAAIIHSRDASAGKIPTELVVVPAIQREADGSLNRRKLAESLMAGDGARAAHF